eukprot:3582975-Rhodomonas_salina.1
MVRSRRGTRWCWGSGSGGGDRWGWHQILRAGLPCACRMSAVSCLWTQQVAYRKEGQELWVVRVARCSPAFIPRKCVADDADVLIDRVDRLGVGLLLGLHKPPLRDDDGVCIDRQG